MSLGICKMFLFCILAKIDTSTDVFMRNSRIFSENPMLYHMLNTKSQSNSRNYLVNNRLQQRLIKSDVETREQSINKNQKGNSSQSVEINMISTSTNTKQVKKSKKQIEIELANKTMESIKRLFLSRIVNGSDKQSKVENELLDAMQEETISQSNVDPILSVAQYDIEDSIAEAMQQCSDQKTEANKKDEIVHSCSDDDAIMGTAFSDYVIVLDDAIDENAQDDTVTSTCT